MVRKRIFGPAVRLLLLSASLLLTMVALAQPNMNLSGSTNCTAADFDAKLRFVNGPGDLFTIIADKRNISNHACLFDGPTYGPSVVLKNASEAGETRLCYDCEHRLPNGQYPVVPRLTVDPGREVRQTFRWKTKSDGGAPCREPEWIGGPPVMIVAPSLLKNICSDIEVSRFSLVPVTEVSGTTESSSPGNQVRFRLTSKKKTYYDGEFIPIRLNLDKANESAQPADNSCPTLYIRQRSPNGDTRIDEVKALAFRGCEWHTLGYKLGDWQTGFEVNSGAVSKWAGVGEHVMEVWQLLPAADGGEVQFASSNELRIQLVDPALTARKWGPRVKGIAVDIKLDKDTYRAGQDVPLHLAIENFDAAVPIYSSDPLWDPCLVVQIEVRDVGGRAVGSDERFPASSICTGHGRGPRLYEKGKIVTMEKTLGGEGWLPNRPGTYTIVVTWPACTAADGKMVNKLSRGQVFSHDVKPYAIASAQATIRIVPDEPGAQK